MIKKLFCGHPVELKVSVCIYFCLTHRRDWSRADASEKCRIRINIWYQIWQFFTLLSINYNNSESSGEWSRWSLQDWGHWLGKYLALKGLSWSEKSFNYYCGGLCGAAINKNIPVQRWVKIFEGFTLRGGRQFCVESAWSGGIKTMYLGCNTQDKD